MGDIIDQFTGENSFDDPAKECKYCGAFPLFWHKEKGKRVLLGQDGRPHKCKNYKPVDPFEGV